LIRKESSEMRLNAIKVAVVVSVGLIAIAAANGASGDGTVEGIGKGVPDGRYEAAARAKVPFGSIALLPRVKVRVAVEGGRLAGIEMLSPRALADDERFKALGGRVIEAQGTEVDGVSGATFSSAAYLAAVRKALSK
jgi:uncharacterized protein with FMN-binding domain